MYLFLIPWNRSIQDADHDEAFQSKRTCGVRRCYEVSERRPSNALAFQHVFIERIRQLRPRHRCFAQLLQDFVFGAGVHMREKELLRKVCHNRPLTVTFQMFTDIAGLLPRKGVPQLDDGNRQFLFDRNGGKNIVRRL